MNADGFNSLARELYKKHDGVVPLHAPVFRGNEKRYLAECIDSTFVSSVGKYVDLVESVRASGGRVLIFSSAHVSGEQLGQLTGVAALLRFPLPLEDDDDASEADAAAGAEVAPAPSAADAAREAAVDMGLG